MNDRLSLVVLAAGNSSRYGSPKQIETFGKYRLTIAEYNLLDALSIGINNVIFVVKEQMADIFYKRLSQLLPKECTFSLAYQRDESKLCKYCNRTKPWGTGHAVLSTKHIINENFGVINADDLYGKDAISQLIDFLKQTNPEKNIFSAVGYKLVDTLSTNGPVSRGIITFNDKNKLTKIIEHNGIYKNCSGEIVDSEGNIFQNDNLVSVNLWGFTTKIFEILEKKWQAFAKNLKDPINSEFYLPNAINEAATNKECEVKVLQTSSRWHGITYQNDRNEIDNLLKNM